METERGRSTDFPILYKMHKPHNTIEPFVFFYLIQAPLLSGPSKSKNSAVTMSQLFLLLLVYPAASCVLPSFVISHGINWKVFP